MNQSGNQSAMSKLHPLDLSKRGNDLQDIFEDHINQIPDLLLPPITRFSGEEDFFDKTKTIKLRPFRKQHIFDTCINRQVSTDKDRDFNHQSTFRSKYVSKESKSKIPDETNVEQASPTKATISKPKIYMTTLPKEPISKHGVDHNKHLSNVREPGSKQSNVNSRTNIKKSIRLRKHQSYKDEIAIGYDRLFKRKANPDYPFANPMPESMMTEQNIDNLRDIIVSSSDIEWKMLTPIRPESEYEEGYFNHLIELHRLRYKSRLESGYFGFQRHRVPFKHSRHPYVLHHVRPRIHASSISLGVKLKSKFKPRDERAKSIINFKLTIPKVTLTTDERLTSEKIVSSGEDERASEEIEEFNYNYFSRFSRRNQARQQQQQQQNSMKLDRLHPSGRVARGRKVKSIGKSVTSSDKDNDYDANNQVDQVVDRLMSISV